MTLAVLAAGDRLLPACGRCTMADEGTVSLWANFSAWTRSSQVVDQFSVPCNESISVHGGRMHPSELALGLLQVLTRHRDYKDIDPFPRPDNIAVQSSASCTLCVHGNFEVDGSPDAFVTMNAVGYTAADDGDGGDDANERSRRWIISFVDDHFVSNWGAMERVFQSPAATEPVAGLDSVHWPYVSVVRPAGELGGGSSNGRLWLYFKTAGVGGLSRAESTDDGRSWGRPIPVRLSGGSVQHAYGVTANENPLRRELGEPDYLLVGDCPKVLYPGYRHPFGTSLWTACVFGSSDGLAFALIANPATSSWGQRDFQIADSVNELRWCPVCQAHVLSSRYAPQSSNKWRHIRGMGFWRSETVSATDLFDLDTWIKFDKQGPLELHRRQIYGMSGSWIDGVFHGVLHEYLFPDEVAFRDRAPSDRYKVFFFTSRDMRNFTLTSVYARHAMADHALDMHSTTAANSLVQTHDRWGLLYASFATSHEALRNAQPPASKTTLMAWWPAHRITGLRSVLHHDRTCYSFLTTKWIRVDVAGANSTSPTSLPLNFKINAICNDLSYMHMTVKALTIGGGGGGTTSERVLATSKPLEGDMFFKAPIYWQITATSAPTISINPQQDQFALHFRIKGECTIFTIYLAMQ